MSDKIINESPILVLPSLAESIGLNEAIVLQQIHFWLNHYKIAGDKSHLKDGKWWVYNTYDEWQENFPWWSTRTIQRIVKRLEELGLIVSEQFDLNDWNQRKWYTIDYLELDNLSSSRTTTCLAHNKNTETTTEINFKENTEQEFEEFDENELLLGHDVLNRTRELRNRDTLTRKGTEQAMIDGVLGEDQIKSAIYHEFRISPNWDRKDWRELLQFLKERPPDQLIKRWARWWYQNDWRGKEGQPPTAAQIQELWPQAFVSATQSEFRVNEDGSFYA